LSYSTYNGDLEGFQFDPGTIELSYDGLQLAARVLFAAVLNR
jgi:hypothetical protein